MKIGNEEPNAGAQAVNALGKTGLVFNDTADMTSRRRPVGKSAKTKSTRLRPTSANVLPLKKRNGARGGTVAGILWFRRGERLRFVAGAILLQPLHSSLNSGRAARFLLRTLLG